MHFLFPRTWQLVAYLATSAILFGLIIGVVGRVGHAAPKPNTSRETIRPIQISARPIRSFAKSGSTRTRYGRLQFLGGLVLSSGDRAFGGLSGFELSPDGQTFMAVSDAGSWISGTLAYARGRPAAIRKAQIGPILALGSRILSRERDRDAEALRLFSGSLTNGIALVGFERNQRIGFFKIAKNRLGAPLRYLRPPRRIPRNKGIEATAVLGGKGGKRTVIAFAERSIDPNGHHRGWLWQGKSAKPIALTNVGGFDITDLAVLRDGSLVVLERRFRWSEGVQMRLRRISAKRIKPGAVLSGEHLLQADFSANIDNMEGLAAHQASDGRTVLTLVSDNNFNSFLQRTVLLQFALLPRK